MADTTMNAHEYQNGRTTTSVSTILSKYPCDSEVAGNASLRMYYGGEGKHRRMDPTD